MDAEIGYLTPGRTRRRSIARTIFAGSIGNTVEWFDWTIYTVFAIYFSNQFFPSQDTTVALLATFSVFAIGFFMRPLGGWLIGTFSDRHGRRSALTLSILLMAVPSLVIALLPTYSQIGVFAPILLVLARMTQGLSVGGEYGAATTFLTESAPAKRRGFYGSFLFLSIALGLLIASGIAWVLTNNLNRTQMELFGWRIPFLIGGLASLIGLWLRRNVDETQAYKDMANKGEIPKRSLRWIWRHHRPAVLRLIGTSVLPAFSFYLFVSYLPIYAIQRGGATPEVAFRASTVSIAIFMCALPFFGRFSDRFGRKPQLIAFACAYLFFLYPVVNSVGSGFWSVLLVECFGLLAYGLYASIAPAMMAELFNTEVRAVGIGAFYNVVIALLGGTTPYLMAWLQSINLESWFLVYVCAGAAISLYSFIEMPETRGKTLD
ncbi:MFS transporter [Bordetella muralis]|uniref:MFS transporter n=1 Tax=Bordetella muralis TaxID=1649130 RepID=UPI0039EEC5AA